MCHQALSGTVCFLLNGPYVPLSLSCGLFVESFAVESNNVATTELRFSFPQRLLFSGMFVFYFI